MYAMKNSFVDYEWNFCNHSETHLLHVTASGVCCIFFLTCEVNKHGTIFDFRNLNKRMDRASIAMKRRFLPCVLFSMYLAMQTVMF